MNYHSDEWIMNNVQRHYNEVARLYRPEQIIAVMYSGSANYNADYENSDVDTWAIVIEDNYAPNKMGVVSYHFDDEVIWIADIRDYVSGLVYSDIWYILPLYGRYSIINPLYEELFNIVIANRALYAYNNVPNAAAVMKQLLDSREQILVGMNKETYHPKPFSYLYLMLIMTSHYQKHLSFSLLFYNDSYGELLKDIKTNFDYESSKTRFYHIKSLLENFTPTYQEYPPIPHLETFSGSVVKLILQVYEEITNGYSNKN